MEQPKAPRKSLRVAVRARRAGVEASGGSYGAPDEEDTMTAMLVETGLVTSTRLADGLLVQLTGDLGEHHLAELRDTLLGPLPSECRDVVVDAGEVTDVDFDA